jgi:hypothetical protein
MAWVAQSRAVGQRCASGLTGITEDVLETYRRPSTQRAKVIEH